MPSRQGEGGPSPSVAEGAQEFCGARVHSRSAQRHRHLHLEVRAGEAREAARTPRHGPQGSGGPRQGASGETLMGSPSCSRPLDRRCAVLAHGYDFRLSSCGRSMTAHEYDSSISVRSLGLFAATLHRGGRGVSFFLTNTLRAHAEAHASHDQQHKTYDADIPRQ